MKNEVNLFKSENEETVIALANATSRTNVPALHCSYREKYGRPFEIAVIKPLYSNAL